MSTSFTSPKLLPFAIIVFVLMQLLLLGVHQTESYRVLVSASNFFRSHLSMHISMADLLVTEGGHEVTMLVPILNYNDEFPPREHTNWTKSQHVMVVDPGDKNKMENFFKMSVLHQPNIWTEKIEIFAEKNYDFMEGVISTACTGLLTDTQLHYTLREQHFDVAIGEWFDSCAFGLFHLVNIPTMLSTSAVPMSRGMAKLLGIPSYAYVPDINSSPPEGTSMNILQRAQNFVDSYRQETFMHKLVENVWQKTFVPIVGSTMDFPVKHDEIAAKASFFFINTNEFLDMAKPISAKVKHIGGFTLQQRKETDRMDARTEQLLANSAAGAVLVSFGSVADPRQMPQEMRQALLDAFGAFPAHTFIWKFSENGEKQNQVDNDDGDGGGMPVQKGSNNSTRLPSNVHRFDWLDQRGILAHPKLRLFISHCGLNSLNEAAFEGVPVLCIPLFGDQNYNAAMVNQRRIGRLLAKDKLTFPNLKGTLDELLANRGENEYAQNMRTLGQKMKRAPFQPRDIILRYLQFAGEFGGNFDELNLEGAKMSTFAQLGLDFMLPIAVGGIAVFAILAHICVLLVRRNYWRLAVVFEILAGGGGEKIKMQ